MKASDILHHLEDERCYESLSNLLVENKIDDEDWRFVITPKFKSDDYMISNLGRVLSLPRYRLYNENQRSRVKHRKFQPAGLMKPGAQPSGHLTITIMENKKPFRTHVHRLVAWAFIGPQPSEHYVRHLDGNPANNHLSNLAYGTPWENITDTFGPAGSTGFGIVIGSSLERRIRTALTQDGNPHAVLLEILDLVERSRANLKVRS